MYWKKKQNKRNGIMDDELSKEEKKLIGRVVCEPHSLVQEEVQGTICIVHKLQKDTAEMSCLSHEKN